MLLNGRRNPVDRTTVWRVTGGLLVLVALVAWAFASPVGASPDEDFHLTSSWCGLGERDGVCEEGGEPSERVVPRSLVIAPCYAFAPDTSAACQGTTITDPDGEMVPTTRGNFTGDYPPAFFAFTSLFVGDDIERSVVVMRVMNALVFVLMTGTAFALATPPLRRALLAGVAVTAVPLGVFIVPSINPSSWAFTSAATVFVVAVVHLTATQRSRIVWSAVLTALAVGLGAGARADAALFAALGLGAAGIVTFRPTRAWWLRACYPAVLALASALSFFRAGQSDAVEGAGVHPLSVSRVVRLLTDVPELWVGALGKWGLGWLDTAMPPIVWFVMTGLFVAAVFGGLRGVGRSQALAIGCVALAAWVIPAYIQYLTGVDVGAYVQPRYILPLLVLLALTATCRLTGDGLVLSPAQRWLAVMGIGGANAVALYINLRRYVTGLDVQAVDLGFRSEWWWGSVPGPMVFWAVGSVAFVGALAVLSRELRPAEPAVVEAPPSKAPSTEGPGQDEVPAPGETAAPVATDGEPIPTRRDRARERR